MACRGSAVQIRLAPLIFSSDTNKFQGQKEVRRADIVTTCPILASAARQTVDNTLGNMVNSKVDKKIKTFYALNPKDIKNYQFPIITQKI